MPFKIESETGYLPAKETFVNIIKSIEHPRLQKASQKD